MATNNRPSTKMTVTYGTLGSNVDLQGLIPVLIAPRYAVHDYSLNEDACALADASGSNFYTRGTALQGSWPAADDGSIVDTNSVRAFIKNATLQITESCLEGTTSETEGNKIVFSDTNVADIPGGSLDPALGGVAVSVGDTVLAYTAQDRSGDVVRATVVAIISTKAPATVGAATPLGSTTATAPVTGGTYVGAADASYLVKVLSVDTANSRVRVSLSSVVGDPRYTETKDIGADPVSVGTLGCTISFSTVSDITVGDAWKFNAVSEADAFKNIVQLDTMLDTNTTYYIDFATKRYSAGYVQLPTTATTVTTGGATVSSDLTVLLTDSIAVSLGARLWSVVDGYIYVNYRELLTSDAMTVVPSDYNEAAAWAGPQTAENPMGLMYAAARAIEGASFYMMSIAEDTEEAYIQAIEYAGQYEDMYAIQPYACTEAVRAAVRTVIAKYADPEIAQFKHAYLPALTTSSMRVGDADEILMATITNGVAVFAQGDPVALGAKAGDMLCVQGAYDATKGAYSISKYPVVAVDTVSATLKGAVADTSLSVVYFSRELSNTDYAEALAAEAASINSRFCCLIWGDDLSMDGIGDVPLSVVAARIAAWRNALPPHAPMSTLTVPGVLSANTRKFNDAQYSIMNRGGVWVLATQLDGTVTNYHQITTLTDGTIAEEDSCVCAGDYIVRTMRAATRPYRSGLSNATSSLIPAVEGAIRNQASYLMSLNYDPKYGRLLLDYSILELYLPTSNKSKLICRARFSIPQPTSSDEYTFNLV